MRPPSNAPTHRELTATLVVNTREDVHIRAFAGELKNPGGYEDEYAFRLHIRIPIRPDKPTYVGDLFVTLPTREDPIPEVSVDQDPIP